MKITRRGRIVRAILIAAGIALGLWMAGHLWYTDTGWCIGSLESCIKL
jgi:hypothetical protein